MKILSSFTHPQVVSYLYEFFSSANIILNNVSNKQLMDPIDVLFFLWKSMGSINCLVTDILQNGFCLGKRNKNEVGGKNRFKNFCIPLKNFVSWGV